MTVAAKCSSNSSRGIPLPPVSRRVSPPATDKKTVIGQWRSQSQSRSNHNKQRTSERRDLVGGGNELQHKRERGMYRKPGKINARFFTTSLSFIHMTQNLTITVNTLSEMFSLLIQWFEFLGFLEA